MVRIRDIAVVAAALWAAMLGIPEAHAASSIDGFTQSRVGDQSAASLVASFPTSDQVTGVVNRATCLDREASCAANAPAYSEYVAYYGDRSTGGFTMRPGFVSGVGAEYAATDGKGSLKISVSSYASSRQALRAAKAIASGVGIRLRHVATRVPGPGEWNGYDVWTGYSNDIGQGVLYAIKGATYARAWIVPPDGSLSPRQWRSTFQGLASLFPEVMAAERQPAITSELQALVPTTPPSLAPVFLVTQSKSAWLPYGKPDPALYAAMAPAQVSLQYAIVGAPETLALNATITPVADPNLAQVLVDRLADDPSTSGRIAIDGLPSGAQAVRYTENKVDRLIYVQFVAKGALNELTCSDLSITQDVAEGRASCLSAIRDAATAMSS